MTAEAAEAASRALAELGITVDAAAFAAELDRRTTTTPGVTLRVFELALAWACRRRSEPAIAYFERTYFAQAERALAKLALGATVAEDVLAWIRFELFVEPDGKLLASYSGRGVLANWVRTIAVHEAVKRARRARREVPADAIDELPMPEPAFAAMRGAYRSEFTRALSESFRALTTQDRNLLRQYFLDGLTIDMLAGLYQIHRATAARRVAAARAALVERVREVLVRELALSDDGVDQVITLENLDESLGQLLRATA